MQPHGFGIIGKVLRTFSVMTKCDNSKLKTNNQDCSNIHESIIRSYLLTENKTKINK